MLLQSIRLAIANSPTILLTDLQQSLHLIHEYSKNLKKLTVRCFYARSTIFNYF